MNDLSHLPVAEVDAEVRIGAHVSAVTFAVYGHFQPRLPATRTTPAEGGFVLERVELGGVDVTHDLPRDLIDQLTTEASAQ